MKFYNMPKEGDFDNAVLQSEKPFTWADTQERLLSEGHLKHTDTLGLYKVVLGLGAYIQVMNGDAYKFEDADLAKAEFTALFDLSDKTFNDLPLIAFLNAFGWILYNEKLADDIAEAKGATSRLAQIGLAALEAKLLLQSGVSVLQLSKQPRSLGLAFDEELAVTGYVN